MMLPIMFKVVTTPGEQRIVMVAWRRLSRRSQLLSEALGAELLFFPDRIPYLRAAFKTMRAVSKAKPDILIVQLPQGPLLLEALVLRLFRRFKLVADVHTGFLMRWEWKSLLLNTPFKRFLGRCDVVAIHNEKMREILPKGAQQKALVVYDPWYMIEPVAGSIREQYIMFPASYHPDEPLDEVLEVAKELCPDVRVKITGNWKRRPEVKRHESERIVFTGYLTNEEYDVLFANASGIISGTKEEYTALMSAWEAIAYAKPLAITQSCASFETYEDYPIYYDWKDKNSIANAISALKTASYNNPAHASIKKKCIESIDRLKKALQTIQLNNEATQSRSFK